MIRYCLGFIFSPTLKEVLLIHKERSIYSGKWNGLGGVVNSGEGTFEAMQREWKEECGLEIEGGHAVANVETLDPKNKWSMDVYAVVDSRISKAKTLTDEEIKIFPVDKLFDVPTASFVRALIYMSLDRIRELSTPLLAISFHPAFQR